MNALNALGRRCVVAQPGLALIAALLGLVSAHASGVSLEPLRAGLTLLAAPLLALALPLPTGRVAGSVAGAVQGLALSLVADAVQRGAWALSPLYWTASQALMGAGLRFLLGFVPRQPAPAEARWHLFAYILPAAMWIVVMIERHALPQHAALALAVIPFALMAARELVEHAAQPEQLGPARRKMALCAHLHGLLLAASALHLG